MKEERLPYLDGWRGLAIGCVLISHFWAVHRVHLGIFGVDLFFVLSGLLMSRILFEQRMPLGKFYRRRISRILPVLWLYVLAVVPLYDLVGHPTGIERILGVLTFTASYLSHGIWQLGGAPLAQTWSLNIEEHCYMLLALIAAFAILRVRASVILAVLAIATFGAVFAYRAFDPSIPQFALRTECTAAPLLLSAAYYPLAKRFTPWAILPVAAFVAAAACYLAQVPWEFRLMLSPFLLAFSVNHMRLIPAWILAAFQWRPLRILGALSYSIYLWQQPFYDHQAHFPDHTAAIGAIVTGALSYYFYEQPIRRWLNAHWGTDRGAATVVTA